jgi:hypothetical protein
MIYRTVVGTLLVLAPLFLGTALAEDPALETRAQKKAPTAFAAEKPQPVLHWGEGDGKSYFVPAVA